MKKLILSIFICFYGSSTLSVFALSLEEIDSISIGIGFHGTSFIVTDKATNESAHIQTKDLTIAPFFKFSSAPNFIGKSNFGYNFVLNYGESKSEVQILHSSEITGSTNESASNVQINLDSAVRSSFFYLSPNLFYMFHISGSTDYFLIGFGIGLGLLRSQGDVYLTENLESSNSQCSQAVNNGNSNDIKSYCRKLSIDTQTGGNIQTGVLSATLEGRWNNILYSLWGARVTNETDQVKYQFGDLNLGIGVSLFF